MLLNRIFELLRPISDASHTRDRKVSPPNSACLAGTREVVMKTILSWVRSSVLVQRKHIFYLYGYAGSGKSAIAQELCERVPRLLASFFFFRNAGDRSQIGRLPNTLAIQLARAIPETAPLILAAVEGNPDLASPQSKLALGARLRALVYGPFETIAERSSLVQKWTSNPYLIVIDGLDECEDKEGAQEFIDCTLRFFRRKRFIPLRVIITSRIERKIHSRLNDRDVYLKDLADHCSRADIETFMRTVFETHTKGDPVVRAYVQEKGPWPNPSDARKLVDHIDGSFIFASALFGFIFHGPGSEDDQSTPMDRLPLSLKNSPGLDALYSATLARSEHLPHFREVISTLALIKTPLPVPAIAELLGLPAYAVAHVLVELQAVIVLPGTDHIPVTFCHTSLRDFLTTESRAGRFYTLPAFHLCLFFRCFIVSLKDRRRGQGPSQRSSQTTAVGYSMEYQDSHWNDGHHVFKDTARSRIFNLCSKARRSPPLSESHAYYLDKLGIALLEMVYKREASFHIEGIVSLHHEALSLRTSSDETRASTLDNLGIALCKLFEETGSTPAVEKAISHFRETRRLRPPPHPHLPVSLGNLGTTLYSLFHQSGCIDHIVEAVEVHREALGVPSSPDVDRSFLLESLGNALLALYEQDKANISHVEEAIALHREALALQRTPSTLSNLGDALRSRGEHLGSISDHDEAISLLQSALKLLEGCSLVTRRWPIIMNIGIAFYSRFRTSGSVDDLLQAIDFLPKSLDLIPARHIYRHKALQYLTASLQSLSDRDQSLVFSRRV
ncbi:hypothetical protein H1R20_g14499, partial [Candolleomyces eurysporus]